MIFQQNIQFVGEDLSVTIDKSVNAITDIYVALMRKNARKKIKMTDTQ